MRWLKIILPFFMTFVTIQARKSTKEKEELSAKVTGLTNKELPYPEILCPNNRPMKYIKDLYKGGDHIMLGILIENYSGMTLKNPQFHPYETGVINTPIPVEEVLPKRTAFFIFQHPNDEVSGSVTWEIFQGILHSQERLIVTFDIPWTGPCANSDREHEYSLTIRSIPESEMKGGNWTKPNNARRDYNQQHDEDSTKSLWGPKHPHWVVKKWSGGQIVTESKIDQGSCTPILTIKLMKDEQLLGAYFKKHGDKNYEYIGKEFEGLSKHCACNTDEQKRTCPTAEQQKQAAGVLAKQYGLETSETSEMSIEKGFMIIIGSVAGGVVFLVVMAILLMKFKKQRRFRGP